MSISVSISDFEMPDINVRPYLQGKTVVKAQTTHILKTLSMLFEKGLIKQAVCMDILQILISMEILKYSTAISF